MDDAAKILKSFQDSYKEFLTEQEKISEASEPEFCECGELLLVDHESQIQEDTIYCTRLYRYVKTTTFKDKKFSKPEMILLGDCHVALAKRRKTIIEKLAQEQTFENFDLIFQPTAFELCSTWNMTGRLLMTGASRTGKTHLARAIFCKATLEGKKCVWYLAADLAELFRRISSGVQRDNYDHTIALLEFDNVLESDVLFIDDLGSERKTESDLFEEKFQTILDKIRGALVITSNLDHLGRLKRYGEKIENRLIENAVGCEMIGQKYKK